jgi:Flp pilus assembly protein TadG
MAVALLRNNQGNVTVIAGILLPVAVFSVAVAIDYSDGNRLQSTLQVTADSAALAGARQLLDALAFSGPSSASAAAKTKAADFASAKAPDAVQNISVSGNDTVAVNLSQTKTMLLGGVLGQSSMTVSAAATALIREAPRPCLLALGADEPIGINLVGAAKVDAPKCAIDSNSTSSESINMQGAPRMVGSTVCASGGTGNAKTSPPAKRCPAAPDPYEGRTFSSAGFVACNFNGVKVDANVAGTTLLKPGVYCGGLSIQSADVKLEPGLYVMQNGSLALQGNSTLSGDGVSILLSGTGSVLDLQGSPEMTLSAMQTGPLANIAIASSTPAVPVLTSILRGSPSLTVTGSIYLPTQRFDLQGHASLALQGKAESLTALSFQFRGSPHLTIDSDSSAMQPWYQGPWIAR